MLTIQEESNKLREEAKMIIQNAFKVPDEFEDLALSRLVDCIIDAAVLQVAAIQQEAITKGTVS